MSEDPAGYPRAFVVKRLITFVGIVIGYVTTQHIPFINRSTLQLWQAVPCLGVMGQPAAVLCTADIAMGT